MSSEKVIVAIACSVCGMVHSNHEEVMEAVDVVKLLEEDPENFFKSGDRGTPHYRWFQPTERCRSC